MDASLPELGLPIARSEIPLAAAFQTAAAERRTVAAWHRHQASLGALAYRTRTRDPGSQQRWHRVDEPVQDGVVMSTHRRRLLKVDDSLEAPARSPQPPTELKALYVRLPAREFDDLARAAFELNEHKRDLVAALVRCHVHPHTELGLESLRRLLADPS